MSYQRANVPCGTCRLCRHYDVILLIPDEGDVIESYEHQIVDVPGTGPVAVVKKGVDGNCIYLGPDGCAIHERAPAICQAFDCRRLFLSKSRMERRAMVKAGAADKEIFEAARKRLHTLPEVGPK